MNTPSTRIGRILVVDDDEAMRDVVIDTLDARGFAVDGLGPDAAAIEARLDDDDIDIILTDMRMPGLSGLDVIQLTADKRPDLLVVMMTAFGSLETAVAAMRAGAWDFVEKPIDATSLQAVLERALKHRRLTTELRRLQAGASTDGGDADLIAGSSTMRAVVDVITQVAALDVTVLITGESGTGKEVVARSLHARSPRRSRPFVAVNCAALPETLLESQLFGHVRGAFTDARADRQGLFAEAGAGTIVLDEFGELPMALQPKLLRALQERCFRPLGGTKDIPFDARIVVATNRHLEQMVAEGRFREDLYYRVNVVSVDLPPLRTRKDDILPLAHVFLRRAAERFGRAVTSIEPAAARLLLDYRWPGNVRELGNVIERAVALTRYERIVANDLPENLRRGAGRAEPEQASAEPLQSLDTIERAHVQRVLHAVGFNRGRASSILGIDPKTLYRKLRAWGDDSDHADS